MENGEERTEGTSIPLSLDFDRWNFLFKGLIQLNAASKEVTGEQLANVTNTNIKTISSNLRFMHYLGFISPDSKISSIKLSSEGAEYGQALIMQSETKEKELLARVLKEKFRDIITFYDLHIKNQDLNFEMLFEHIKFVAKCPKVEGESGNTYSIYRAGIHTLLKMLIFCEIIDKKFDPEINSHVILKDKSGKPRTKSDVPLHVIQLWMEKTFQQIRDMNPTKIESQFIKTNVIGSGHEGSVLNLARFIGLTDKEGNHGENYEKLRLYGSEEFKKNLTQIIRDSYSKIFEVANITTVERSKLEDAFITKYNLSGEQARNAVSVFINLCKLSDITLSELLLTSKKSNNKSKPTKGEVSKIKKSQNNDQQITTVQTRSIQDTSIQTIPYQIPETPFKINLNINIDVKDKETLHSILDIVKHLKKEMRNPLPELDLKLTETNYEQ